MANWKYKIDLKGDREAFEANEIDVPEFGKRVATKIRALPCFEEGGEDMELEDLVVEFNNVLTVNEFDNALDQLYDWGDMLLEKKDFFSDVKQCWIAMI